MFIKSIKLIDIQSWDKTSPVINLAYDRMNTFIAPSETGKSVVIKVLKEMCFPNNWGYNRMGLIRRGCTSGTALFTLEDDTVIVFIMFKNGQKYAILTRDGDKYNSKEFNNETEIPEEVADLMGLIIDRKGKTVINVIDKEMPKPLITTNPKLSGRIIATVTENSSLEKIKESLINWQTTLKPLQQKLDAIYSVKQRQFSQLPEKDTSKIRNHLDLVDRFIVLFDALTPVLHQANEASGIEIPKEIPDLGLEQIFDLMQTIIEIIDELESLDSLKKNATIEMSTEPLKYYDVLMELSSLIEVLNQASEMEIPAEMISLGDLNTVLSCLTDLTNLIEVLSQASEIEIPTSMKQLDDVYNALKILNLKMDKSFNIFQLGKENLNGLEIVLNKSEKTMHDFQKKIGICPLCGCIMNGGEVHKHE